MPRSSNQPSSSHDNNSSSFQHGNWDPSAYDIKGMIPPIDEDEEYIEDDNGQMEQEEEDDVEDEEREEEDGLGFPSTSVPVTLPDSNILISKYPTIAQQPSDNSRKRGLPFDARRALLDLFPSRKRKFEQMSDEFVRHMELPMARVKKIMKIDDDVQAHMISQDAPVILSTVAELLIEEITLRAWGIVEEGRRKTLQKCDIAGAICREEHFDFLIDIVPREEARKCQQVQEAVVEQTQPVQYMLADCDTVGTNMYQLDNGQIVHATAIGQPIPIADPSGDIEVRQIPQGIQVIHMPQGH